MDVQALACQLPPAAQETCSPLLMQTSRPCLTPRVLISVLATLLTSSAMPNHYDFQTVVRFEMNVSAADCVAIMVLVLKCG